MGSCRVTSECVCTGVMHKTAPAYRAPLVCSFNIMRSFSNMLPKEGTVRSDNENAMQLQYAVIACYERLVRVKLLLSLPEHFSTTKPE